MASKPSPSGLVTPVTWTMLLVAEARVARADRRLGDARLGGDVAERLAAVLLQRLDDRAVDRVEPRAADRAGALRVARFSGRGVSQCAAIFLRRPRIASTPRRLQPVDSVAAQAQLSGTVRCKLAHADTASVTICDGSSTAASQAAFAGTIAITATPPGASRSSSARGARCALVPRYGAGSGPGRLTPASRPRA